MSAYADFLARKRMVDPMTGVKDVPELPSFLFPHQRDIVAWALRRGRAAIFAGTGLGKTHLLQAITWAGNAGGDRRVLYLTAERFMYGFVAALKNQSAIAFKGQLRGIDVLSILGNCHGVKPGRCATFGQEIINLVSKFALACFAAGNQDIPRISVNHAQISRGQLIDVSR